MKYVIEHLEPRLFKWCILEYKHISRMVGKNNLIFTNLKNSLQKNKLRKFGRTNLKKAEALNIKNGILLDPGAENKLTYSDCKKYDYLIFGGILGDYPPRKRTKHAFEEIPETWIRRNLGKIQMPTDTAVRVAHMIANGKKLSQIEFIDSPSLKMGKNEEVNLPYRYVADKDGSPIISKEIVEMIKKKGF